MHPSDIALCLSSLYEECEKDSIAFDKSIGNACRSLVSTYSLLNPLEKLENVSICVHGLLSSLKTVPDDISLDVLEFLSPYLTKNILRMLVASMKPYFTELKVLFPKYILQTVPKMFWETKLVLSSNRVSKTMEPIVSLSIEGVSENVETEITMPKLVRILQTFKDIEAEFNRV